MKKLLFLAILLIFSSCSSTTGVVTVDIDYPTSATVGEAFDVVASITNGTSETQLLTSIDLDTDILALTELNYTDPMYFEEWDMDYFGIFSYDYYLKIEPGETLDVTFNLTSTEAGFAGGDLNVCYETESNCIYSYVGTYIE